MLLSVIAFIGKCAESLSRSYSSPRIALFHSRHFGNVVRGEAQVEIITLAMELWASNLSQKYLEITWKLDSILLYSNTLHCK